MAYLQDPHCERILAKVYDLQSRDGRGPNQHDLRRQRNLGAPGTIIRHLSHLVDDGFLRQDQRTEEGSNHEMIYAVSDLGVVTITELAARQTGKAILELRPEAIAHAAWTMSEEGNRFSRPTEHPLVAYHEGKPVRGKITFGEDWRTVARARLAEYHQTFGCPTLSPGEIAKAVMELDRKRLTLAHPPLGIISPFSIAQVAPRLPSMPSMPYRAPGDNCPWQSPCASFALPNFNIRRSFVGVRSKKMECFIAIL